MLNRVLSLAVVLALLSAPAAYGSGGQWYVPAETATTPTGGCTLTGTSFGRGLPICDNATDGTVILHTYTPNFCASPAVTMESLHFVNQDGTSATNNSCHSFKAASYTDDADADEADITFSSASSQVSKNLDDCDTNNSTDFCTTTATDAVTPKNLSTGSGCSGTACNMKPLLLEVTINAQAGCTTPTSTDVKLKGAVLSCQ